MRNEDLLPVPPERRTWSGINFVAFWISDGLNLNTFMIASTAVSASLSWRQTWAAIIIGYVAVTFLVVATARIGAVYHVSFPILARSTFGIWGAIWPTLNRAIMACIWYGVQSWIGGQCVTLVLRSLAPSYNNLANSLPGSSGTKTRDFLSFFLFSLLSLPIVYLEPEKVRIFFNVKSVVVPIAAIAFFAWSVAEAKGLGPIIRQPAKVSGTKFSWAFLSALMSCISNMATLVLNIPDLSRMAKSTRSNPVDILDARLNVDPYDSSARAGVFFIALAFIIGQIGTNIAANSLSAGHDLTALFPRFITIRRGSFVAAAVGFAMCPWHLVADSNSFATYLSAYSLFLSSISGTMLADYYINRRGGFNLRAFAAYIAGIAMSVTGFAGVLGANVSVVAERIYILAYPVGFLTSGIFYLLLCHLFPVKGGFKLTEHKIFLEPKSWEDENWDTTTGSQTSDAPEDMEKASAVGKSNRKLEQEVSNTEYRLFKEQPS